MIGSDKVEGTGVYGPDNQKIGEIERVMIEKTSGRVSYAVVGFGGFLGIGNDHYPLPWDSLKYDTKVGGYPKSVFGSSGSELFDWTAKRAELDSYYDNIDTVTTKEAEESPLTRSSG